MAKGPLAVLKQVRQMIFSRYSTAQMTWGFGGQGTIDFEREVGDGSKSNVIAACTRRLIASFKRADLQALELRQDGSEEPFPRHDLISLLRRPNPFYAGRALWGSTVRSMVIDGNAYWVKIRTRIGAPAELWWVPPHTITPKQSEKVFVTGYTYKPGDGQEYTFDVEDVVHFRNDIDPNNMVLGISPLKTLLREVFTDEEASAYTAFLMRNRGMPGLIISPPEDADLGKDEYPIIKKYFEEQFTLSQRGKPLVAPSSMKVDQIGFNPQELNLGAIRNIPEERICSNMGVPPAVISLGTGVQQTRVGATLRELRREIWEGTLIPMMEDFSEQLGHQLLPDVDESETTVLRFNLSRIPDLQDSPKERAERWSILMSSGIATRGQGKLANDLPAGPEDDVYLIPANLIEYPAGEPFNVNPPPSEPRTPASPDNDPDDEGGNADDDESDKAVELKATRENLRLIRMMVRDATLLQGQMARRFQRDLNDLGRRARDAFLELAPSTDFAQAPDTDTKQTPEQTPEDEILAAAIIDRMRIPDWTEDRAAPTFRGHYIRTLQATTDTINAVIGLGVNIPDHRQREVIALGGRRLGLIDFTSQARDSLFNTLHEARSNGWGPPRIAREIRSSIPRGRFKDPGYRANLIARTETKYAQNVSSLEAYEASDTITGVIAFDAQIGDTDTDCEQRDQRTYSFSEARRLAELEHPNGTLNFAPSRTVN